MKPNPITAVAAAHVTDAGREVLAFHLHRYLAHWLAKSGVDRVWITTGWEHASLPCVTIEVGRQSSQTADVDWDFATLLEAHHEADTSFDVGALGVTVIQGESSTSDHVVLGFALAAEQLAPELSAELEIHAAEAIRAARRNSVRMFFDDCNERDMKTLLYTAFDRLPEWVGCDVAAAVVLANSLEAMTLEHASEANFYVMAERLYSSDPSLTRLVGLAIDTRDDHRTVVDAAIDQLRQDPKHHAVQFLRGDDGYLHAGERVDSIGKIAGRPDDRRSVLVPLVADRGESELLGFLCVAFSGHRDLPASAIELLEQVGRELGHLLRTSPLYTLSAGRLKLLRSIAEVCQAHVAAEGEDAQRRDELVRAVVDLVRDGTSVPAFSVGYVTGEPRKLRYTASYGWSNFETIELLVDVADNAHADSGVSSLAVRLARPVVLAGGHGDHGHQEFKNFLWVHEATGRITDARAPGSDVVDKAGWTRLGAYYTPARIGAYATVAHPIMFNGRPLGVMALEVDRETDWTWWAGYGAELLWELVGSELAFALWALGG